MQTIKAIIFDFDGTIVDSEPAHKHAWDLALKEYSLSLSTLKPDITSTMVGKKPIQIAEEIIFQYKLNVSKEQLSGAKAKHFRSVTCNEIQLSFGVVEILTYLQSKGYLLAIGSSGERDYIAQLLTKHNLFEYFAVIVTGDEVLKSKPDPETYITVTNKLAVLPQECIVVEDALSGVLSAKKAGCYCMAYSPVTISEADNTISSLLDIKQYIA